MQLQVLKTCSCLQRRIAVVRAAVQMVSQTAWTGLCKWSQACVCTAPHAEVYIYTSTLPCDA